MASSHSRSDCVGLPHIRISATSTWQISWRTIRSSSVSELSSIWTKFQWKVTWQYCQATEARAVDIISPALELLSPDVPSLCQVWTIIQPPIPAGSLHLRKVFSTRDFCAEYSLSVILLLRLVLLFLIFAVARFQPVPLAIAVGNPAYRRHGTVLGLPDRLRATARNPAGPIALDALASADP